MTLTEFVPSLTSRFPTKHRFAIITHHYLGLSRIIGESETYNRIDDWFTHIQEPIDYPKEALNFLKEMREFPAEGERWDVGSAYLLHVSVTLLGGGKISAARKISEDAISRIQSLQGKEPGLDLWLQDQERDAKLIKEVTELMIARRPVPDVDKFHAGLSQWSDAEEFDMFDTFLAKNAVCEYMEKFHGLDLSDKKILPDSPAYKTIFPYIAAKAGGAEWVVGKRRLWA